MEIRLAAPGDLDGWMALVEQVRDSFPGLETREAMEEHRNTVRSFMARQEAICAAESGAVKGALLFSREAGELCFLAVDGSCRRRHIARRMVERMLALLGPEREITVTTYRAGVPEGAAARAFYKRMGFEEGRLTEEFGSPVQEFRRPGNRNIFPETEA
ncbi:GNAT family N-acetyltransferase [Dysosmobacter sp.]|uniref:GNAT family N-acetyltransferase n=1 Tax=Dysosmobacter sp. TaxID=2591382 RepID=UPI002A906300|nr:GNAT family N-acetyltransferase [Dysosmobacter sp.]MDY3281301.1 GNAT family N-acetyltransferase [Dysosmobacter sp.]